ncbi:hypothetical protein JCM30237_21750 [Halolamina litorea]
MVEAGLGPEDLEHGLHLVGPDDERGRVPVVVTVDDVRGETVSERRGVGVRPGAL